jgi:NCS1 family nucleobase:cation symporter-1
VPIAAWAGIFLADLLLRRKDYADAELAEASGRYGRFRVGSIVLLVVATVVGWGLVTNTYADWLSWQGYLLGPIGGKEGAWAFANLGVLAALLIGFVGTLLLGRGAVRAQEALPLTDAR